MPRGKSSNSGRVVKSVNSGNSGNSGRGDRLDRVGDLIHRSISRILQEEFKDPRIGMVTISGVELSRDLTHAKIFITVFEPDNSKELQKIQETLKILNDAAGFFRRQLAAILKLRVTPKPRFLFDDSVLKGSRISALLANQNEGNEKN